MKTQQPIRKQPFYQFRLIFNVCVCAAVLGRFQAVPGSDVIVDAEDAEVLKTMSSDLTACVRGNTHTRTHSV